MTKEQKKSLRIARNLKSLKQECAISDPTRIDAMAKRILNLQRRK
jgi:hypothetical protein